MWLVNPARARAPAHRAHTTPESELGRAATPLASVQAVRTLSALSNSVGPPKSVHPIHWLRRESAEGPSNLIITKTRHSRVRVFCSPFGFRSTSFKAPTRSHPCLFGGGTGGLALFLRFVTVFLGVFLSSDLLSCFLSLPVVLVSVVLCSGGHGACVFSCFLCVLLCCGVLACVWQ